MPSFLRRVCFGFLLILFLLPISSNALPIVGSVPEKSATFGPTVSLGFGQKPLLLGLEGVLAYRIYWLSLSSRFLISEESKANNANVLELGLSLLFLNVGVGWQAQLGENLQHGPTLSAALALPLADTQSDGARILKGTPFVSPFYRLSFLLGEEGGLTHEIGLSLRLWWH